MRKEHDNQPEPITLEQVSQIATDVVPHDGYHVPTVIVDGSRGQRFFRSKILLELMKAAGSKWRWPVLTLPIGKARAS